MTRLERTEWKIDVEGGQQTTAVFEPAVPAAGKRSVVFVCAHGAGGSMDDRGIVGTTAALRSRGVHTVRYNFLYKEKGSGRPDPMPRLQACVSAVVARTRESVPADVLLIGGRSMGGRASSMLAAEGFACDGLLLLAYPLHPTGHPEKLRDAHLSAIGVPVLCINGTRDSMCRRDLMEQALRGVPSTWRMHWIDGADHGFHVPASSGRTDAQVVEEIGDVTQRWFSETFGA